MKIRRAGVVFYKNNIEIKMLLLSQTKHGHKLAFGDLGGKLEENENP